MSFWKEMFGQGGLLIVVIFLGMAVMFGVLWGKRQVLRVFLITRKGPLGQAGCNAPKELRKEIEESFDRISKMRLEPKLLSDEGDHEQGYTSFVDERDDSSYKYRRKAFDLMSCLDELLCRVNISLARKHFQTVRQHLQMLQTPPFSPFEELGELCEKVTCLYEHARYGAKEFSEDDFIQYSNCIDQLYDRVHQKFVVPGSLLVNADHHQQMQNSEYHENFDGDSLIEPTLSIDSSKKFTCIPDSKKAPIGFDAESLIATSVSLDSSKKSGIRYRDSSNAPIA